MDKILICTEDTSNKVWGYKINGLTVTVKWGRLGTAGQSKDFSFADQEKLDKFVSDKTEEKLNKGYEERSPEQLELETVVAQTIGVGNKIEKIAFVRIANLKPRSAGALDQRKVITALDPKKDRKILHDPKLTPLVYAHISGRRKDKEDYNSVPSREFLLSMTEAKIIKTKPHSGDDRYSHWDDEYRESFVIESELPVEINDEAQAMSKAVGECIGKLLL